MDDGTKTIVKLAAVGGALALAYWYLNKSGMWQQWFGGGSTFTDNAQLLAYCAANPTGSATFVDGQGGTYTRTCAQWRAANPGGPGAIPVPEGNNFAATPKPLVERLRDWALANEILGTDSANMHQWNYGLRELDPNAVGYVGEGMEDMITAAQYLERRTQSGLSGLTRPASLEGAMFPGWVQ